MIAENIVSSNCRCVEVAELEGPKKNAAAFDWDRWVRAVLDPNERAFRAKVEEHFAKIKKAVLANLAGENP